MSATPRWFTVVAVLALLWNLLGCTAFVMDLMMTPEAVAKLSAEQQVLDSMRPMWAVFATGTAVIGGALGSLGLMMKKRWATMLLVLSLLGVIAQDYGLFFVVDGVALGGMTVVVLQGCVLLIAIGLVMLSRKAAARGWLS